MPAFVGHYHLDKNVGREYFRFNFLFRASVGFDDGFGGDADIENQMPQTAVFDDLLQIHLDLVFIAGVGMRDVPSGSDILFVEITHYFR